jgi:replicative DNA helicase
MKDFHFSPKKNPLKASSYLIKPAPAPSATDLEKAVLGSMLIDQRGLGEAINLLSSKEVFYKDIHKDIFQAICQLFENAQPIDLYSVAQKLKENNLLEEIGGEYYLVELELKSDL